MKPSQSGNRCEPRRRRSSAKHAAILSAASELAARDGYHKVTIEQIAAQAGVGKQTIYRWWPSKLTLYLEVYAYLVPEAALSTHPGPVAGRLQSLLASVFERYAATSAGDILRGLIGAAQTDDEARQHLARGLVGGRGEWVVSIMREAQAGGELPGDFDADWAKDVIVSMIWKRLLDGRGVPDISFASALVDYVLSDVRENFAVQPPAVAVTLSGHRPGDLGNICAMQAAYYAREWGFGPAFEVNVAEEMAGFLSRFDPERDLFVTALAGDEIVGSIILDGSETKGGRAHLRWLFVAEGMRGSGLGRRLMERVDGFAAEAGIASIYLTTFQGLDAARALYESFGYRLARSRVGETWGTQVVEQTWEKRIR